MPNRNYCVILHLFVLVNRVLSIIIIVIFNGVLATSLYTYCTVYVPIFAFRIVFLVRSYGRINKPLRNIVIL